MTTRGLFLYKPCRKTLFIFRVDNNQVEFRMWESAEDIQGSLVLRGNLDNLEMELLGKKSTWTKWENKRPIFKVPCVSELVMGL